MPRVVLVLALLVAVLPASAHAEGRSGSLGDPAGDSTAPGADLTRADLVYDTGGDVTAKLTFAAAPTATDVFVSVAVGIRDGDGTCAASFVLGTYGAGTSVGAWSDGTDTGSATRTASGTAITLAASDLSLSGENDCFHVELVRRGNASETLDDGGVGSLAAAPEPTATPEPTTPSTKPKSDPKPKATPLERYDAALRRCAKRPRAKRAACRAAARRQNKAGARLAAKRRHNPLIGRVYLQVNANPSGGTLIDGLSFADDRFVYSGVPEDGPLVARCRRVTAKKDGDGCRRYTRRGTSVRIGGTTYRIVKGGARLVAGRKGNPFFRTDIPRPGLRIAAAVESISSFGIPGVDQSFSSSELTFSKGGRFVAASAVSGTTGGGSDFETTFTALPKDRRGTYRFETGGTLALHYADGHTARDSAAIGFGDKGRRGVVARDGLVLDGSFYSAGD